MTTVDMASEWERAYSAWLAEVGRKSVMTAKSYVTAWNKYYALMTVPPWEARRVDMINFSTALTAAGLGNGTINFYLAALRSCYTYVIEFSEPQLLTRNPARGIDELPVDTDPPAWISKEEADQTIEAIPAEGLANLRDAALLETLWRTAMRNTAVRSIRLVDFRMQDNKIWLSFKSKGKANRAAFPTKAWQRLQTYLEARTYEVKGVTRTRWDDLTDHLAGKRIDRDLVVFISHCRSESAGVFGDAERRALSIDAINDICQKRTLSALGRAYTPHSWRHGAAHALDELGVKVQDISAFLTHSSVDITMHYLRGMQMTSALADAL